MICERKVKIPAATGFERPGLWGDHKVLHVSMVMKIEFISSDRAYFVRVNEENLLLSVILKARKTWWQLY